MTSLVLVAMTLSPALNPGQPDAARVARQLERLSSGARVLYVAAHPDDENTRLIAWLVQVKKVDVAYLSLTRGDGGQNLIGAEQGPALGLLRTQELLAARRIDGARQFFTRARDFGYSKNPEEALRFWGHDRILEDVVWVYRTFRPDVVITRFSPADRETHGHHTASAQLALEAFGKSNDPAFAPEQLAARTGGPGPATGASTARLWQPRRILWNAGWFQSKPPDDLSGFLKEEVSAYDPLLGLSMGELAADSRTMHKSQGFGAPRNALPTTEYFQPLAGEKAAQSILDGVPLSLAEIPAARPIEELLVKARSAFRPEAPELAVPALVAALHELDRGGASSVDSQVPDPPFGVESLRHDLREAIVACAGLLLQANAQHPALAAGAPSEVALLALQRRPAGLTLASARLGVQQAPSAEPRQAEAGAAEGGLVAQGPGRLAPNAPWTAKVTLTTPPSPLSSDPPWLREPPEAGFYPVEAREDRVAPENAPAVFADFTLRAGDVSFTVRRPVLYRWTDPVLGERTRALEVAPPATVDAAAPVLLFPDAAPRTLRAIVRASAGPVEGQVRVDAGEGFAVSPATRPFKLAGAGDETEVAFEVKAPAQAKEGGLRLSVEVTPRGSPVPASSAAPTSSAVPTSSAAPVSSAAPASSASPLAAPNRSDRGRRTLEYAHVPPQAWHPRALARAVRLDLKKAGTRIGYVMGAGDEVPKVLAQLGYAVTPLDEAALRERDLSGFDAIVIGVRAFNVHPWLAAVRPRLLGYVESGGTVVTQYMVKNWNAKVPDALGPFPFTLSRDRVTDETAAVKLEAPTDAVLRVPNAIGPADFEGWVQERGLYFASDWDQRYAAPLSMHDPGEQPMRGSLLVGRSGKGRFVYTGLAFFRQLPAGVPGAIRLFANLLARESDGR